MLFQLSNFLLKNGANLGLFFSFIFKSKSIFLLRYVKCCHPKFTFSEGHQVEMLRPRVLTEVLAQGNQTNSTKQNQLKPNQTNQFPLDLSH